MNSLYQRKFNVDYFEKDTNTWSIISNLIDEQHDITLKVDISVPGMIIENANIKFKRYPLELCMAIEQKANQLKGMDIQKDYREKAYRIFMGTEGCPNVMNLLGVAVPGFMYTYYPHLVKTGRMKKEDLVKFFVTNYPNDCLAHTLFNKNNKNYFI